MGAKPAIEAAKSMVSPKRRKDPTQPTGSRPLSTDPVADFFDRQENACIATAKTNRDIVGNVSTKIGEKIDARTGVAILEVLAAGFTAMADEVEDLQALETAAAWIAGISQAQNDSERLDDGTTVSKVFDHVGTDGLLTIKAELDPASEENLLMNVKSARIRGVSQAIVDRLWDVELATVPVPIDLVVTGPGSIDAHIWRDESGRVFSEGLLPVYKQGIAKDHIQDNRSATEFMDIVTRRSLADWGVARIETDDANRRKLTTPEKKQP